MLKNHNCGELGAKHIEREVTLAGWVHRRRDHGGLVFIDLRDRSGLVQVVFNPETSPASHVVARELRNEYVLMVTGQVSGRPAGTENPRMATGEIEVLVKHAEILNPSKTPPFYINEEVEVDEALRLQYRYLDLRRPRMQDNLTLRYRITKFIRDFLDEKDFIEIETPILIKSTPEGARDYLVPSRLYPGKFYALPQSPQQLKQLLMVAGYERYFQIARCFRDEDLRADRQPEFTQLDLEMSFVNEEEDILILMEELFVEMVARLTPEKKVNRPFPRLPYREVMLKYGSDKPDLRYGLDISDISDLVKDSEFGVFSRAVSEGGYVRAFTATGCAGYSRRQLDELGELARTYGASGVITISLQAPEVAGIGGLESLTQEMVRSAAARFLSLDLVKSVARRSGAAPGDLIIIVAGPQIIVERTLGSLRQEMAGRLGLLDPDVFSFAFVVGFPLLEWKEQESRWEPMHHMFTTPQEGQIPLLDSDPGKVQGKHYDLVCNGYELGGGSIRIHTRELQEKIFGLLGYSPEDAHERFGHMLDAFEYGAPPHGGIAFGLDRVAMIMAGAPNIREVIPFPKTQSATDLMTDSPSSVPEQQLAELHIKIAGE
ncbi:MAG: aspartate--tRNA ligase [Dehalococcoidia bacterium]|nr:aspartate--tRNA ligase [Dehalococcoidia bacterium]